MKERCEYMQEVNSLCKDVERETTPLRETAATPPIRLSSNDGKMEQDEQKVEEGKEDGSSEMVTSSESNGIDLERKLSKSQGSEETELTRADIGSHSETFTDQETQTNTSLELGDGESSQTGVESRVSPPNSPSSLNPELVDLATEVKDLNVRFSNVCMQAKHHYAALSKVLTASIERHSSVRSTRSKKVHYVKITQINERNDEKNALSRQNSLAPEDNLPVKTSSARRNNNSRNLEGNGYNQVDGGASTSATTNRPNRSLQTTGHDMGVAPTSKASVLATTSPRLSRSLSLSTGTDIDAEILSCVQEKYRVVLRSKSVSCDEYSDTEPRSKKRPKSAVIIEPNADGETALVSEVQLRNGSNNGSKIRRRSMEISLSSLTKTGLLSPSNRLNQSPASPAAFPRGTANRSPSRRRKFGSLSALQARDRNSVISIESLDPRTVMISGQLQQNSYDFNSSFGSDATTSSMTQISDLVPERRGARVAAAWNGNHQQQQHPPQLQQHLGVGGPLQAPKRSASMEAISKSKG